MAFHWGVIGAITVGLGEQVRSPALSTEPGVYRFRGGGQEPWVYIGETDNVQRRLAHYRKPDPRQQTNIRLNAWIS
jgi:excinuclease UvrABC nuclease subunit